MQSMQTAHAAHPTSHLVLPAPECRCFTFPARHNRRPFSGKAKWKWDGPHPQARSSRPSKAQSASASAAQTHRSRREALAASLACVIAAPAAILIEPLPAAAASQHTQHASLWEVAEERADLVSPTVLPDLTDSERQVLRNNQRIQLQNGVPLDFPIFVREGFTVKVLAEGYQFNTDGLIFKDFEEGTGEVPTDGQEVLFHYTAYNESGRRIDSSYQKGVPARTRMGIQGLIPGFEIGIRSMRVGGKRRLVVPPELGPPTGPATFFSAKQCEVFDVELLQIKNCVRRKTAGGFFSDVVCE